MRSDNAADYQSVPRPVAVMRKSFPTGVSTGEHSHIRGQVLYATSGLMLAQTGNGAWAVPTGHALLLPPGLMHNVTMHGGVQMLTAYIAPDRWREIASPACQVIVVSQLLDAALAALCEEPVVYSERGRGGHLAAIIMDELRLAPDAELALPLPASAKLRRICDALLVAPGLGSGLDQWAEAAAMSRRSLTRLFRDETGLSFGEWRRRLRQMHSLKLQAEGLVFKDIAGRVGYSSPQALRAMIKRDGRSRERPQSRLASD